MKGKGFLIMPLIGVSAIIYILVISIPVTSPPSLPITYEINTLSELCENLWIFSGYELEVFQSKLRDATDTGMDNIFRLTNEYADNIMWNNKINPVLDDYVRQHVLIEKYVEC